MPSREESREFSGNTTRSSRARVAVIGAGIFGVMAALRLVKRSCAVDLFEKSGDILRGATGSNQFRLHRGYHYPRSLDTAVSCKDAEASFRQEFGAAILDQFAHYYCIAKDNSLTSALEYLRFCDTLGLEYENVALDIIDADKVALSLQVRESLYGPEALRALCWEKLRRASVSVHLNASVSIADMRDYDFVVVATYSAINECLASSPEGQRDYQFEVCEKPVVRLPSGFYGRSVVVMDGPFMCFDPLGSTGLFVLGNVVHGVLQRNVGKSPVIDQRYRGLLHQGIVPPPSFSRFDSFISEASQFFPEIVRAEHVGSMFTIRTVFPDTEETDERPTLVQQLDERVVAIFSGKVVTAVLAADQVADIVVGAVEG